MSNNAKIIDFPKFPMGPSARSQDWQEDFDRRYEEAKHGAPKAIPPICKVDALPLEGTPIIINGLWRRREIILLGGHAKSWKSWAQMDLSYCIANGLGWLVWPEVAQGRVLHIDLELLDNEIRKRFELIQRSYDIGSLEYLDVLSLRGYNFSLGDFSRLADSIELNFYSAISLDPTYRMLGGSRMSESDPGVIIELMNRALELAEKLGTGISLLQHFSKGDQNEKRALDAFSGTGVWGRAPDCCLTFRELETEKCYNVTADLRHWPPVEPFAVQFVYPRFMAAPNVDPENLKRRKGGRPKAFSTEDLCNLIENDEYVSHANLKRRAQSAQVTKGVFDRRLKEAKLAGWLALNPVDATYFLTSFYLEKHRAL